MLVKLRRQVQAAYQQVFHGLHQLGVSREQQALVRAAENKLDIRLPVRERAVHLESHGQPRGLNDQAQQPFGFGHQGIHVEFSFP